MKTRQKFHPRTDFARAFKRYFWLNEISTKEDRQFRLGWRQGLCLAAFSGLGGLFADSFRRFDLARPLLAIIGTVFIALTLRWRLRDRLWFWVTIISFAALSVFLVSTVTWSTEGPSRGIIGGIMAISGYFLFVILHAIEAWFSRASLKRLQSSLAADDLTPVHGAPFAKRLPARKQ